MKLFKIPILILSILFSCDSDSEKREYYESGNLKSIEKEANNIVERNYYFDDGNKQVRTRIWCRSDTVIKVQYYSDIGELFYESVLNNKELHIESDSSALLVNFVKPTYDYLNLAKGVSVFTDYFDDFYYDFKTGNGYHLRIPYDDFDNSLFTGILFDEHYDINRDSSVWITSEHMYFSYRLP